MRSNGLLPKSPAVAPEAEPGRASLQTEPAVPTGKHGFLDRIGEKLNIGKGAHRHEVAEAMQRFQAPEQVKSKHYRAVKWIGRIGFVAKGIVYGIIGGLACQSAINGESGGNESPQGAFILVGSNTLGAPLLCIMAGGLGLYVIWRFWEAITGQGTDAEYTPLRNFFRFRLSPFVSGCVYTAYMIFVITLVPKARDARQQANQGNQDGFPNSWKHTGIGKFGLTLAGIAFLAATIVSLQMAFTRLLHKEMRKDLNKRMRMLLYAAGHVGFLARAGVFLFVAVLFFRYVSDDVDDSGGTTVASAMEQLKKNTGGRIVLFALGLGLIIYALYCALCSYCKVFPTPPPSGHPVKPYEVHKMVPRMGGAAMEAASNGHGRNGVGAGAPAEDMDSVVDLEQPIVRGRVENV